jgi:predicted nucleic acid-binding protein
MIKFPTKIIIDTGPLFDFLVASCWLTYFRTFPSKHLQYIKSKIQYNNLKDYIFSTELILITPYVIGEINYQIRKMVRKKEVIYKFWKLAIEFLTDSKFQESTIKIVELNLQKLFKWEITDAFLISLMEKTKLPIFTGDSLLWNYCKVKGRDSLFIYEITEYRIR